MIKRFLSPLLFMAPFSLCGAGIAAPLPPSIAPAGPGSGSAAAAAAINAVAGTSAQPALEAKSGNWPARDEILGAGVAGPYLLSRTGIVSFSEAVLLNGQRQLPVVDYQLNTTDSTLTFTHVVRTTDVVTVRYFFDAAVSKPTPQKPVESPLDINVAGLGGASVRMLGAYTLGSPGAAGAQGFSRLGLAVTETAGKDSSFGTQLLFSPGSTPIGAAHGQSGYNSQQTAIGFNGQTGLGGMRLSASWMEAGKQFTDTKAAGAAAGGTTQSVALAGGIAPHTTIDAGFNEQRSGSTIGQQDDHIKIGIAAPGGSIVLARTDALSGAGNSAAANATTSLNVDQKMGSRAELKVAGDIVRNSKGSTSNARQDGSVGLSLAPAAGVTVSLTETRAEIKGSDPTSNHAVAVGVGKMIDAKASLTQTGAGHAVGADAGQFSLKVNPTNGVAVSVDDQYHQDQKGLADHTHAVGADLKDGSTLSVSAKITDKSARGVDDVHSDAVGVGFSPAKSLDVKFKTDHTDSGSAGVTGDRTTDLVLAPAQAIKLSGTVSEQYGGKSADSLSMTERTVGAGVSLDPGKTVHFGAGYSEDLKNVTVQRDRSVDARVSPLGIFLVDGHYVERDSATTDVPDTAVVAVGFHPAKMLGVDGSYTQNPQDAKGQLSQSIQRSLSVTSDWGLLDFSGKYSQTTPDEEGARTAALILSRQFDIGLSFSPDTRMFSSYEASSAPLSPTDGLYRYKVGLTHRMGDIFSFSLAGQVDTNSEGMSGIRAGLRANSQAKVGLNARW